MIVLSSLFAGRRLIELSDVSADLDIDRVWFTEVAYGRCSATGNRGLDRLDKTAASAM